MSTTSKQSHGSGGGPSQALLYDPAVPTPTHAERARTLVGRGGDGALSTVALEPAGFPYGSFVLYAVDEAAPVFLISEMAEHTRNLRADSRASLLVVEPGEGEPLSRGRVTLVGRCALATGAQQASARAAILAAHPSTSFYADFTDFNLWRLGVDAVRYIGGFGRMSWIDAAAWTSAEPDPLAPAAAGILSHMNDDHGAALLAYCHAFSRATDATKATMTGVDRYGFELSALTGEGPRPVRVAFPTPLASADAVRKALVGLVKEARELIARRGA